MHICYVSPEYPIWSSGGIGSFIQSMGKQMVKRGVDVSFIAIGEIDEEQFYDDEGIKIWRIPCSRWPFANFYPNSILLNKKLMELHAQNPIDIIESSEQGLAFLKANSPFKKIIRMHGGHHYLSLMLNRKISRWKAIKEKLSFRNADKIVAVSASVAKKTSEYLQLKKEVKVILNPVDTNMFYAADLNKMIKGKILFIGTVYDKKGIKELVQAMMVILKRFPDTHLDIVGRDGKVPETGESYTKYLKRLIPSELKFKIHFKGEVDRCEIPQIIEQAEICVFPSYIEALPIAWLEALSMGKPFIGGDMLVGREVIREYETGLLVNTVDVSDIVKKIEFFLENPQEALRIGENARQDVVERFNIEKLVDENISYYYNCKSLST